MKKLIIFDLDGTLLNTLIDLKNAVNFALKPFKYPLQSNQDIRKHIGNGVKKLIERSIPSGLKNPNYTTILAEFRKYYFSHTCDYTYPYRGIKNLLSKLKKENYILAVCTNKIQKSANELINQIFPTTFDYIQGDEEGINNKPHSDMINKILMTLEIDRQDTLYIGDTEVDRLTAINSNLDYILVTYGYRTINELNKTCPDSKKASMRQLFEEIRKY